MLNQARELSDLHVPPSNLLEPLKGDLKGYWSIRGIDQWRIIFKWSDGNAREAAVTDYHR